MTTATLTEVAEKYGREHAAAYHEEFGEPITPETAGDWDAVSLGEAYRLAKHDLAVDELDWSEFRLAYLQSLYGPEIEVA